MNPDGRPVDLKPIQIAGRTIPVPRRRWARLTLGGFLVVAGVLPIPPGPLWVPVGLLLLSIDIPMLSRLRRRWMS